jgi:hypothetical protein
MNGPELMTKLEGAGGSKEKKQTEMKSDAKGIKPKWMRNSDYIVCEERVGMDYSTGESPFNTTGVCFGGGIGCVFRFCS